MPNSEAELWGQINFIKPGTLHRSFYGFRNTYFHLERNGEVMHLRGRFVTRNEMREILSTGWRYVISPEKRYQLMEEIKPFTHWIKKEGSSGFVVGDFMVLAIRNEGRQYFESQVFHIPNTVGATLNHTDLVV